MTPREKRLERRLCERERELIDAQRSRAWYFEHWCVAAGNVPRLAQTVAELIRCKRAMERMGRRAA